MKTPTYEEDVLYGVRRLDDQVFYPIIVAGQTGEPSEHIQCICRFGVSGRRLEVRDQGLNDVRQNGGREYKHR